MLQLSSITPLDGCVVALCAAAMLAIRSSQQPKRPCKPRAAHLPGPSAMSFIGNAVMVFKHRQVVLEFLQKLLQYGPVSTFTVPFVGPGRNLVIGRPEWLEHIKKNDTIMYDRGPTVREVFAEFPGPNTVLGSDGADWKVARRTMQPLFGKTFGTTHVCTGLTEILPDIFSFLKEASSTKTAINWSDVTGRIALGLFLNAAFSLPNDLIGPDLGCLNHHNEIAECLEIVAYICSNRMINPTWHFTDYIDGSHSAFNKARRQLLSIVDAMIADRIRKNGGTVIIEPHDFLDRLLQDLPRTNNITVVRETLLAALFGGHDTLTNSLQWAVYELQRNSDWVEKLRKESESHPWYDGAIPFERLVDFPIHQAVCYEVLRLYPGISQNFRVARCDDILPALPEAGIPEVQVFSGDRILWSDLHMMRSSEVWGPDAAIFNPQRFFNSQGQFVKPSSPLFVAFGAGVRSCPAMQLALHEMICLVRALTSRFEFEPIHPGERKMVDGFTPFIDGEFWLNVKVLDAKYHDV